MTVRAALLLAFLLTHSLQGRAAESATTAQRPPNVVLFFCDDLGYADIGCFGAKYPTPHIDRLAREGVRFTDFYAAQAVCSASRAALLTGCYPNRVGISGALSPSARIGLNPKETTLAEVLKARGYSTGIIGKWHLGSLPEFLPTHQGFDEWFGLPYSNDMWPFHPEAPSGYPSLPLYDGDRVINPEVKRADQNMLTTRYTERAVQFIQRHRDNPFFLYFAHSMPHVPLHVASDAAQDSPDLYAKVIGEIDASVGEVLRTLGSLGLDENTLVIFTSDNGPWLSYGDHGGSVKPLREGKGTAWEGGVRVPFVARWPGRIPAGTTCSEPTMTIDLLPTLARFAGAPLPTERIDGKDIGAWLLSDPAATPRGPLWFYYSANELQAIRDGRWKLILPHTYRTLGDQPPAKGGIPVKYRQAKAGLELYDLVADPAESNDLASREPDVVQRLQAIAEQARADLGDRLTGRQATGARPAGSIPQPPAQP